MHFPQPKTPLINSQVATSGCFPESAKKGKIRNDPSVRYVPWKNLEFSQQDLYKPL